jgi:hypothetical protein
MNGIANRIVVSGGDFNVVTIIIIIIIITILMVMN